MNDNPTGTPATPTDTPSESLSTTSTNYSRWMTDMAADIVDVKLHQLAIPGAHNSGVDKKGTWGLEEQFGACQIDTFAHQLAAGARYLDLRLEDKSYWKFIGNFAPERVFVEAFLFTHGPDSFWFTNPSAGRSLQYLIAEVKRFTENNPREIVIIDFHHFKKVMDDCLERAFHHLTPIKHLLIPNSASDLTIGEIHQKHPGRNIVLIFNHGDPKDWKPEWVQKNDLWPSFKRVWSLDYNEQTIEKMVVNAMLSPPLDKYWVLSAAARSGSGPLLLRADHPIRTETFRAGRQNANIVMVDFIEKAETVVSVTDNCISLNKLKKYDVEPPSTPKNLTARQVEGNNLQNTVEFNWDRADHGIGVRKYEVYDGDTLLFITNDIPHRVKNLPSKNYMLKVRAININDQPSNFSTPFIFIQDVISPTVPDSFKVSKLGPTIIELEWQASFDAAGIAGYEVSIENHTTIFTSDLKATFRNLVATQAYTSKIRAKDNSGFYSEYNELEIQPRTTKLENPRLQIQSFLDAHNAYTSTVSWDLVDAPDRSIGYEFKKNGSSVSAIHVAGKKPSTFMADSYDRPIALEAWINFFTGEKGEISTFNFTFYPTPPLPVRNLKILSRTPTSTIVKWDNSSSPNIVSYAISLNDAPPSLVPETMTTYEFIGLPTEEKFIVEVWAVNELSVPSIIQSVIIEPYGAAPRNFRVSNIADQRITFAWSPPFADQGKVIEYKFAIVVAGIPLPVPVGLNEYVTIDDRTPSFELKARLKCLLEGGAESPWIELIVPPRS